MHNESRGICFNIQNYSVHDGPGIRTILFMKGCPLRCAWCSNPESQRFEQEIGYSADKCLGCGRCVEACPNKALALGSNGLVITRERCSIEGCGAACSEVCPSKAIAVYGFSLSPSEALDKVERDSAFYARSGGGMTLSGGEPLAQPAFLDGLLREAEKRAVDVAVESCGFSSEQTMLEMCKRIDYLLFDLKHPDPAVHERVTGVSNEPILRNLASIRKTYPSLPVHVRTPVVPGVNDTPDVIASMARLACDLGATQYELLPFHRMGEQKYRFLDREYQFQGRAQLTAEDLQPLLEAANRYFPTKAREEEETP
ncbi:glycyl-radical enzyme activating protein [Desulfovibrio sp. OttesenSCG-928-I05]|nr:glycyl-radical enzyme activating protein [Desulfovibrio sp. OttesenSCG-928-I05]